MDHLPPSTRMVNRTTAAALARAMVSAEPTAEAIVARGVETLGKRYLWLSALAKRYLDRYAGKLRPTQQEVERFLLDDPAIRRASARNRQPLQVAQWIVAPPRMQPVPAAAGWSVPAIVTIGQLAEWLHLTPSELDWFADLKAFAVKRSTPELAHYRYRVLIKQSGRLRLIEQPKPRLKQLQRQILREILEKVPLHPAVHGFVKGRSIRSFAAPHVGQDVVLRMDMQDFFPSITGPRIQTLFRVLGYPEAVADLLGGLCTNAVPPSVWRAASVNVDRAQLWEAGVLYRHPHLPQGAPTSPALANLCAYHVDCRLSALSEAAGATYTRYADDLAFSGGPEFERCAERFSWHVMAVLNEEGFAAQPRKTRVMRQGVRQHLAGLVTNQRLNIRRADYDRLKAILTNCVRHGPAGQNREGHPQFRSHLDGRVGFVQSIHPERGQRLRAIFDQIVWE